MSKKNKSHSPVSTEVEEAIGVVFKQFLLTQNKEFEFPSSFFSNERAHVHALARQLGIKSKSRGKGLNRFVTIFKQNSSTIIRKDTSISLNRTSRKAICNLILTYPITPKERHDLLPVTERDRSYVPEASFRESVRAIGRLTISSAMIPPSSVNLELIPCRKSLPIWPMKDQIIQEINSHSVVIITGETASGKTTQVPQMIMDYCEKFNRPCKIICSQPHRISAVTLAERVSLERNENLSQAVGFQIQLESNVSPRTVLTYTTYQTLLRTLLGGDSLLSSVTHIFIDEIQEREKLSDFILVILRDAIAKYKGLKLILMSASYDSKIFAKYFNNCPVITVPGRLYEVQEYFLEDILKTLGYMTDQLLKVKIHNDKKNKQLQELEKWMSESSTAGNTAVGNKHSNIPMLHQHIDLLAQNQPEKVELEKKLAELLDNLIHECWFEGTDKAFTHLTQLIFCENISPDYQHSTTGLTPLMAAAFRGDLTVVDMLLSLGADCNIQCSNKMSALDFARKGGHNEVFGLIEAHEALYEGEQPEIIRTEVEISAENKQLLDTYYNSTNNYEIDNNLVLAVLQHIHSSGKKGAVLIFLPGYEAIVNLREKITSNDTMFLEFGKLFIVVLHSKLQTIDQKQIFKPVPSGYRKIILATKIAETSITIDDVTFVIDTGLIMQKCYNPVTNNIMLKNKWISQDSVRQRKSHAGRSQPGVCFHLFSSAQYRSMESTKVSGLLHEPLQDLCLSTKLLAPPNTPIADFLGRAIEPPSFHIIRNSVQLLKTIDALDPWEDLTELGHHLLEIPLEPRLGKTIIYGVILKCLDPVLTIVSCISIGDPFLHPSKRNLKRLASMERKKFAANTFSDHMALLRVFQGWQAAKHNQSEKAFCEKHFVNGARLELITIKRTQVLSQLRSCGFVKIRGSGDIRDVNMHSDNWPVVKAALVGGLYPNLARIDRDDYTLRTQKEFKVLLHPCSTLRDTTKSIIGINAAHASTISKFPSDWIVYEELNKLEHTTHIKTCTVVSPITLAIFGGPSRLSSDAFADTDPLIEEIDSDSDNDDLPPNQTALLKLDDWITFSADSEAGHMALQLRIKWHTLLSKRLRMVNKPWNQADETVMKTLVSVLSAEEQALGLEQPQGVGQRPRTIDIKFQPNTKFFDEEFDNNDESNNAFLSTIENSGARFPNQRWVPDAAQNKNDQDNRTQYFVIKVGHLKSLEHSMRKGIWSFTPNTERKILQSYKAGKTIILIFGLQSSGHFQGYARLTGDKVESSEVLADVPGSNLNPPLPIEWLKQGNIPFPATRHLVNPYCDNNKVQASRDGQELEPNVGKALCKLWDNPLPGRTVLQSSQNYHGRPIRGRFHQGSHYLIYDT
uniref:RNA helicase n=1 Tax=Clastoptera arizonana TaxID=38151 RepID=A0A1B6C6P5_9HEMI